MKKLNKDVFLLTHTAKAVEYTITGFRNKNKDFLPKEIENVIMKSSNEMIAAIYENKEPEGAEPGKKVKAEKTLAGKFRGQMKDLMQELMSCDVNFIRCIKPNEVKQADFFLGGFVLNQIKYLGVLESIRIRKEGFPYRKEYANFFEAHLELIRGFFSKKAMNAIKDTKEKAGKMLEIIIENGRNFALFGKTKIYLKQDIATDLDRKLMTLYKEKRKGAEKILKQFRRHKFRLGVLKKLGVLHIKIKRFCRIQAFFKRKVMRKRFLAKKQAVARIKRFLRRKGMRSFLKRWWEKVLMFRKWTKKKQSAVKIFGFMKKVLRGYFLKKWGKKAKELSEILKKEKARKEALLKKEKLEKEAIEQERKKKEQLDMEREKQEENARKEQAEKARREAEKALQKAALAKSPRKKQQTETTESPLEPLSLKSEKSLDKSLPKENTLEKSMDSFPEKNIEKLQEKPIEKQTIEKQPIEKQPIIEKKPIEKLPEKQLETPLVYEETKHDSTKYSSFDKPKIIEILTKSRGILNLSSLKPLSQDLLVLLKTGLPIPTSQIPDFELPKPPPQPPSSGDLTLDIKSLDSKLVSSLTQYTFWQYAEPLVAHQKSWGKSLSVASVLSFSKSSVNIPILPHSDTKDKEASVRVFNLLKKFLLTKDLENELLITMKIVMEGFYGTTGLRDEVYLQILKQINNNPDKFMRSKLYKLMGVIGSTFPVSVRTYCVILSFLLEVCQGLTKLEPEQDLIGYAGFCFNRVMKGFETGAKSLPPLEHELKSVWQGRKIPIKVNLVNNKPLTIYIESWTTVGGALEIIEKELQFAGVKHYLGFVVKENLMEDQFLSEDVVVIEELTRLEFRRMKDTTKEYRLFVKLRHFFPNISSVPAGLAMLNLTYYQCLDEFLKGTFQGIQLDDIVCLASLHLYIEKGGSSYEKIFNIENSGDNLEIGVDIEKYTPRGCINKDVTKQYLLVKVLNKYLNNKERKSLEASKLEFCNYLKRFDEFMGVRFVARYLKVSLGKGGLNESPIEEVLVYFKPFLILIVSKGNKSKNVFHYKEIEAFGTLGNPKGIFAFRTFDLQIHLLECAKDREMEDVMKGYMRLLEGGNKNSFEEI